MWRLKLGNKQLTGFYMMGTLTVKRLRTRRAFYMKSITVFIIFKGLSLKQIKPTFLDEESLILIKNFK